MRGVCVAVLVALAGCVEPIAGAGRDGGAPTTAADIVFDAAEACFYGRVMDDELRPLPNATVTITETRAAVTSNHEGNFRFCRLAPGNYTLFVFLDGYELAFAKIKTLDGTGSVQVVLAPVLEPHTDVRPFSVFHRFGASTVNVSQASQCGPCAFNFYVAKTPTFLLYEATWVRTLKVPGLADSMYFDLRAGNPYPGTSLIMSGTLLNPIRIVTDAETMLKHAAVKNAKDRIPLSGSVWCGNHPCQDQRIDVWVTSFYDYKEYPTNYTALRP